MQQILTIILMTLCVGLTLSACGIKPGNVKPPSEAEGKPFPSSYPKNARQ